MHTFSHGELLFTPQNHLNTPTFKIFNKIPILPLDKFIIKDIEIFFYTHTHNTCDQAAAAISLLATTSYASRCHRLPPRHPLLRILDSGSLTVHERVATTIKAITMDSPNAWAVFTYGGVPKNAHPPWTAISRSQASVDHDITIPGLVDRDFTVPGLMDHDIAVHELHGPHIAVPGLVDRDFTVPGLALPNGPGLGVDVAAVACGRREEERELAVDHGSRAHVRDEGEGRREEGGGGRRREVSRCRSHRRRREEGGGRRGVL